MVKILNKRLKKATQENERLTSDLQSQSGLIKCLTLQLEEQESKICEANEKCVASESTIASYKEEVNILKLQEANVARECDNLKLVSRLPIFHRLN